MPAESIDADAIAATCRHYSGADIDGLIEVGKDLVLGEILDGGDERPINQQDLMLASEQVEPSTLEWLKTARNLVKFGGAGTGYKDVARYLKSANLY